MMILFIRPIMWACWLGWKFRGFVDKRKDLISIVAPVYNEEVVLDALYARVRAVLDDAGEDWELILVNDGSRDGSADVIARLHESDARVKGISFSRNFGFQIAATAGLDYARGDAVILTDADLQDPPEVYPAMLEQWRAGYDVVYGVRASRQGETWFKLTTAKIFYRLIHRITSINIPLDTGDFRLMDRRVINSLRGMNERNRFLRGMVPWVGFRQIGVEYNRDARYAGEAKFTSVKKMLPFALDAITSFSIFLCNWPLYWVLLSPRSASWGLSLWSRYVYLGRMSRCWGRRRHWSLSSFWAACNSSVWVSSGNTLGGFTMR